MSKRQPDAAGLLTFLWDRFDVKAATDEELQYLSAASEEAANAAWRLSEHISGVGGLIQYDRGSDDKPKCGALQDTDQAGLLYRIANELETIGRLAYIGSESDYALRTRLTEKLAASKSRRTRIPEQSSTLEEV